VSSLTVRDRTKHQAPVWRKHCWKMVGKMFTHSSEALRHGNKQAFR
jgi:hypothetical protein